MHIQTVLLWKRSGLEGDIKLEGNMIRTIVKVHIEKRCLALPGRFYEEFIEFHAYFTLLLKLIFPSR